MNTFWTIFGIICLALFLLASSLFLLKKYFEYDSSRTLLKNRINNINVITPLKLQAYERLAIFLERIGINQLIIRIAPQDLIPNQYKTLLIAAIRSELEHNISQQIYISNELWSRIIEATERTINLINLSYSSLNENANAIDLATLLLSEFNASKTTECALETLRKEVSQLIFTF